MNDLVTCTVDDLGIAVVTLNRPDKLNTMTAELLQEARAVFSKVANDPDVRVMILTGAGRSFCAGGDMSLGPGGSVMAEATGKAAADILRDFMETSNTLHTMPAVTIAAINGACAGAGLSWACAADLRFASTAARFNTAFRDVALSGDFGGSWTLPRIIGLGRAREKYLLPKPFDADEALRIGLVTNIFPPDLFDDEVYNIARELAKSPPIALKMIKQNLVDSETIDFETALDSEAARHSFCGETEDAIEAAKAFVDKRQPAFSGR